MRKSKVFRNDAEATSMMGGARQVILSSKETMGDVYLVEGIMPEGSTLSPHTHTKEDEIFHVLEGSVEVILGDELIKGVKGDIIYLPRGIKHGIRTLGAQTARVLNYVIPGENFENFFNELNAAKESSNVANTSKIAQKYGIHFE